MITSFFKPKPKETPNMSSNKDTPAKRAATAATTPPSKRAKVREAAAASPSGLLPLDPEVEEFLAHLDCPDSKENEEESEQASVSWSVALNKHFAGPTFFKLAKFVAKERASGTTIYPPPEDTFSALNWTPLDKVKICIVGQDPYHGPNQAHGLCFSVRKGVAIPPSLRNMYKELVQDPGVPEFTKVPTHGYLERWAKQGVLMINAVMTVQQGKPNSHKKQGWEEATDAMIRAVDRACADTGIVFLLWGKPAAKKTDSLLKSGKHTIITTSHPSPLGATKTSSPFMGSHCFSRANKALEKRGMDPIDWRVDGEL